MSAYSDWKAGALTDEEFEQECADEERMDQYMESLHTMQTDECCASCEHGCKDDGEFWCMCKDGPEYLEDVRWDYSCGCWEGKEE